MRLTADALDCTVCFVRRVQPLTMTTRRRDAERRPRHNSFRLTPTLPAKHSNNNAQQPSHTTAPAHNRPTATRPTALVRQHSAQTCLAPLALPLPVPVPVREVRFTAQRIHRLCTAHTHVAEPDSCTHHASFMHDSLHAAQHCPLRRSRL